MGLVPVVFCNESPTEKLPSHRVQFEDVAALDVDRDDPWAFVNDFFHLELVANRADKGYEDSPRKDGEDHEEVEANPVVLSRFVGNEHGTGENLVHEGKCDCQVRVEMDYPPGLVLHP